MKKLAFALALLFATAVPASAENCNQKVSWSINPNDVLMTVAAGWFQWLNPAHWATCTESGNHLHCTIYLDPNNYDFYWYTGNGKQFVIVYDQNNSHFRDITNSFPAGTPWNWNWDNGARYGRMTFTCHPDPINPCYTYDYGTCD